MIYLNIYKRSCGPFDCFSRQNAHCSTNPPPAAETENENPWPIDWTAAYRQARAIQLCPLSMFATQSETVDTVEQDLNARRARRNQLERLADTCGETHSKGVANITTSIELVEREPMKRRHHGT